MSLRSFFLSTLAVLALASSLAAQDTPTTPSNPDPPTVEEVNRLIEVMKIRESSNDMVKQFTDMVSETVKQQSAKEFPDVSDAERAVLNKYFDRIMKAMQSDEMLEESLQDATIAYRKHLTRQEVQTITSFFESPAGKSYLEKSPVIAKEILELGRPRMQALMEKISKTIKEESDRMVEEIRAIREKEKATPANPNLKSKS